MNTTVLIALIVLAAIAIISVLIGYIVRITGTTAGIADIGRAIGALIAELITAFNRTP